MATKKVKTAYIGTQVPTLNFNGTTSRASSQSGAITITPKTYYFKCNRKRSNQLEVFYSSKVNELYSIYYNNNKIEFNCSIANGANKLTFTGFTTPLNEFYDFILRWTGATWELIANGIIYPRTSGTPFLETVDTTTLGYWARNNTFPTLIDFVDVRISDQEITDQEAIDITNGTRSVDEVLYKSVTGIIYNDFDDVVNITNQGSLGSASDLTGIDLSLGEALGVKKSKTFYIGSSGDKKSKTAYIETP